MSSETRTGNLTAEHPSPSATCRYQDETGFVSKKDAEDFAEVAESYAKVPEVLRKGAGGFAQTPDKLCVPLRNRLRPSAV